MEKDSLKRLFEGCKDIETIDFNEWYIDPKYSKNHRKNFKSEEKPEGKNTYLVRYVIEEEVRADSSDEAKEKFADELSDSFFTTIPSTCIDVVCEFKNGSYIRMVHNGGKGKNEM